MDKKQIKFPIYLKTGIGLVKLLSAKSFIRVDKSEISWYTYKDINCNWYDHFISGEEKNIATKKQFEAAYFRAIELTKEFI